MFLTSDKTFFVSEQRNLFPQRMIPSRLNCRDYRRKVVLAVGFELLDC